MSPVPSRGVTADGFAPSRSVAPKIGSASCCCVTTGTPVHVAGRLRVNSWGGSDSVQMFIDDAAPA